MVKIECHGDIKDGFIFLGMQMPQKSQKSIYDHELTNYTVLNQVENYDTVTKERKQFENVQ